MRAFSLLRPDPWYRRQAFERGIAELGYQVQSGYPPDRAGAGDVLLIWNRYSANHDIASAFERRGGTVLVAENGYLGKGGSSPKFDVHPGGPKPHHYYALSKGFHNGAGSWPSGGPERFAALEVEVKPWRTDGDVILVCPNRSFGVGAQVMHPDWGARAAARIRRQTGIPVVVRAHPGNDRPARGVEQDLPRARAVVVWSSSVAVHALLAGIPTFIEAPAQIVKGASACGPLDAPDLPDRMPHLERMAWAQWTLAELETGLPFHELRRAGLLPPAG